MWSEDDYKIHLARFCCAEFGPEWVHGEVTRSSDQKSSSAIDLIITDPDMWKRAVSQNRQLTIGIDVALDLGVEIASLDNAGTGYTYFLEKVRDDVKKLQERVRGGYVKEAAACVIDLTFRFRTEEMKTLTRRTGAQYEQDFVPVKIFILIGHEEE